MALNNPLVRPLVRRGLNVDLLRAWGGGGGGSELPAADGWVLSKTYIDGGASGLDLAPLMDVVSAITRKLAGFGFWDEGSSMIAADGNSSGPAATFALSTPYDLSTAVQTGTTNTWGAWSFPWTDLRMSTDGSQILWGNSNDRIWQLNLSTNFELNTGDAGALGITDTQFAAPLIADGSDGNWWIDPLGTYVCYTWEEANSTRVGIGHMTTPFDVTTFVAPGALGHFDIDTEMPNVQTGRLGGCMIQPDGLAIYLWDGQASLKTLHRWDLGTAWDASTMTNHTSGVLANTGAMIITPEISHMYIIDRVGTLTVYEYIPT